MWRSPAAWQTRPLSLDDIKRLPARTLRVTLECAGNGRAAMTPRYPSMPWTDEAVGTAEWTGTPLRHLLDRAGLLDDAVEIAFIGADRGFDRGHEHNYGRSLTRADGAERRHPRGVGHERRAAAAAARLAAAPDRARLVRHGERQVARTASRRSTKPYDGFQQVAGYHYRSVPDGPTTPVTHMRVKSLLVPPGIPDLYTRERMADAGDVPLLGRAWSGAGVPIARVEVGVDGVWHDAQLEPPDTGLSPGAAGASHGTRQPGEHELACRATDANGETQPLDPRWDTGGFGNNVVHRVRVTVR